METVKSFTNFSKKSFSCEYDGKKWPVIKSGKTIVIPGHLANHFAKHLIDRELNEKDIPTNNELERNKLMSLCITEETLEAESVEAEIIMRKNKTKEEKKVEQEQKKREKEEEQEKIRKKRKKEEEGLSEKEKLSKAIQEAKEDSEELISSVEENDFEGK